MGGGGTYCMVCKVCKLLAGFGALNWGLVALFDLDLVAKALGGIPIVAKIVYILIRVAGLLILMSLVKSCPCSSGSCSTSSSSS